MRLFTAKLMLLGVLSGCSATQPVANSPKAVQMDDLIIEPVGGFVGAGGPGHAKSEGRMSMSALSPQDQAIVNALFSNPQPTHGNFYYRLTRQGAQGTTTIEVPSEAIPPALAASVKTSLE